MAGPGLSLSVESTSFCLSDIELHHKTLSFIGLDLGVLGEENVCMEHFFIMEVVGASSSEMGRGGSCIRWWGQAQARWRGEGAA